MTISSADNWGATAEEIRRSFPCDERLEGETVAVYRALSIRARPAVVFRWLCQMRVAPYSYDWIDNLGRQSPRSLTPGLSELRVGQRVMLIFTLVAFAKDEHLTLELAMGETMGRLSGPAAISYVVTPEGANTRLLVKIVASKPTSGSPCLRGSDLQLTERHWGTPPPPTFGAASWARPQPGLQPRSRPPGGGRWGMGGGCHRGGWPSASVGGAASGLGSLQQRKAMK